MNNESGNMSTGLKCNEPEVSKEVPELLNILQNKLDSLYRAIDTLGVKLMPVSIQSDNCINEGCCDKNPAKTEIGSELDINIDVIESMICKVKSIITRLEI